MFICTISTADWVDKHLARWVRFVKASNPAARLGLVAVGCGRDAVLAQFDKVVDVGEEGLNRDFWNTCRMSACKLFDEPRVIYCDADADIYGNLGWLDNIECGGVGFVRSPSVHGVWKDICEKMGMPVWEANNGFLVLERDMTTEYAEALKAAIECGAPERIRGTVAFNLMLRRCEQKRAWRELPYKASTIWWDTQHILAADCLQWCNDHGQERRIELERLYREAYETHTYPSSILR